MLGLVIALLPMAIFAAICFICYELWYFLHDIGSESKPQTKIPIKTKRRPLNIFNEEQLALWNKEGWASFEGLDRNIVMVDEEVKQMFGESDVLVERVRIPVSLYSEIKQFANYASFVYFKPYGSKTSEYVVNHYKFFDFIKQKVNKTKNLRARDSENLLEAYKSKSKIRDNKMSRQRIVIYGKTNGSFSSDYWWNDKKYKLQAQRVNFLEDDDVYQKEKELFGNENKMVEYEEKFKKRFNKFSIKSSAAYKDYMLKTITAKYMCCVPSNNEQGYEYNPVKRLYYAYSIGPENVYEEYAVKEFEMLGISISQ